MGKSRFKLTFRQIMVGSRQIMVEAQRALVIAVAPIPGQTGWLQAVLALENGHMMQRPITKLEFDLSARNEVVMMEVEDQEAPSVPYDLKPGEVR